MEDMPNIPVPNHEMTAIPVLASDLKSAGISVYLEQVKGQKFPDSRG